MSRSDLERLRDARIYSLSAKSLARDCSADALAGDADSLHALLFRLIVVGETIGKVTRSILALEPDTPWRNITDTRNRLIHAYWQVDLAIIADLIESDLGPLVAAVDRRVAVIGPEP